MHLLVVAVLCAAPDAGVAADGEETVTYPITPIQADLSVATGIADRPVLGAAIYVGAALGWAANYRPSFFGGLGVEVTYAAFADPYRISMGGQLRLGVVWARHRGFTSDVTPDLLLYFRLTPFGAGIATQTKSMGMTTTSSSTFFGIRAGVGITSIWGVRQFIDHFPFFDVDGIAGDILKVATAIVLFPIAVLNHTEVGFEYTFSPVPLAAVLFRFGTGF